MRVIIHRGTHQIGGVATEICTSSARILIDMGDELGLEDGFIPTPLSVPGVTDANGSCDAVLFTHNHADHVGQLISIRDEIPLYMGGLAKDILQFTTPSANARFSSRIKHAKTFIPGERFQISDMFITPFSVDHSACDSYMFLIEAEGKRILHTGDFRLHGFRGKAIPKILEKIIGKSDVLITEGTTLSRPDTQPMAEQELQQKVKACLEQYKYVFVLCASTNLERICALSKSVPQGKYFICDEYQDKLLDLLHQHWGDYSSLYRNIKKTVYGENLLPKFRETGFLMMVRDNRKFRKIIRSFNPEQSIILYSMWDGYRTSSNSRIPDFLSLAGQWEPLHTSGHASANDIKLVIEKSNPDVIIPIHTDSPTLMQTLCPGKRIVLLEDKEEFRI